MHTQIKIHDFLLSLLRH